MSEIDIPNACTRGRTYVGIMPFCSALAIVSVPVRGSPLMALSGRSADGVARSGSGPKADSVCSPLMNPKD